MPSLIKPSACALIALLATSGCNREVEAPQGRTAQPASPAAQPAATAAAQLEDVIETSGSHIIGVSFAPAINKHPQLAQIIRAHSEQARSELMEAVAAFGNDQPPAPYELSLNYGTLLETPELVAVSVDGSRYTGGAHGEPIVERFVWLPKQQRMLTAEALVPDQESWNEIGSYIREQLHTSVSVRADQDDMSPEDRSRLVREADKNIREGTTPEVVNFRSFEPRVDASGKITGLRFIFPPYQVGPYVDGTQAVEVPAGVLLPHVAPEYAGLFARS